MIALVLLIELLSTSASVALTSLKIQGSTTVHPVASDAAEYFRAKGWRITVDTQGGSSAGISAIGEGIIDIGMVSKPVTEKDRKRFPGIDLVETVIGYDGVALVVSKALFDQGVRALSTDQIRQIYESKIRSWKSVGGPDWPIVFFNKEPGRGTWEVFAHFLYGAADKAPAVFHPEVGGNEEGRSKVASHRSAMTQLSASWASEGSGVRSLALIVGGKQIVPSLPAIADGRYPLRRALAFVTRGQPKEAAREFIDYCLSPAGQKYLSNHGYHPIPSSSPAS